MDILTIKFNTINGDMQIEDNGRILGSRPWQDVYDDLPIDTKGDMVTWLRDVFEDLGYDVNIEDFDDFD